ncbi:hypothetical protein OUZ56_011923 [Daphnia magna]|uniref:Uncharacterized protein n=1 Tax=Daphnia magna TaxID=35525 RepID=A0ABQ9Z1I8_9CRUS|nr:hypothetical protein OUZ56_011923 [Daphnia magna]
MVAGQLKRVHGSSLCEKGVELDESFLGIRDDTVQTAQKNRDRAPQVIRSFLIGGMENNAKRQFLNSVTQHLVQLYIPSK